MGITDYDVSNKTNEQIFEFIVTYLYDNPNKYISLEHFFNFNILDKKRKATINSLLIDTFLIDDTIQSDNTTIFKISGTGILQLDKYKSVKNFQDAVKRGNDKRKEKDNLDFKLKQVTLKSIGFNKKVVWLTVLVAAISAAGSIGSFFINYEQEKRQKEQLSKDTLLKSLQNRLLQIENVLPLQKMVKDSSKDSVSIIPQKINTKTK